jgi:hypothetical protein
MYVFPLLPQRNTTPTSIVIGTGESRFCTLLRDPAHKPILKPHQTRSDCLDVLSPENLELLISTRGPKKEKSPISRYACL